VCSVHYDTEKMRRNELANSVRYHSVGEGENLLVYGISLRAFNAKSSRHRRVGDLASRPEITRRCYERYFRRPRATGNDLAPANAIFL